MRRAKILATLGPATNTQEKIEQLINAGLNAVRINMSHGTQDEHDETIRMARAAAKRLDMPLAILVDLSGPKIRTGRLKEGTTVFLETGARFVITSREVEGTAEEVSTNYKELPKLVETGARILLDDGAIELVVESDTETDVVTRVVSGGLLAERKGINLPNTSLPIPSLTEKDRVDLDWAMKQNADYIALSFVRRAEDCKEARDLIKKSHQRALGRPLLVAKIEKAEAIENLDAILKETDGVMVARGDLGVETSAELVPVYQKQIIEKAVLNDKFVITATQMLQSMIVSPRPTRAEASDVANAVWDGTDAVMLSAETAAGQYPVESVATMKRIIDSAETVKTGKLKRPVKFMEAPTGRTSQALCKAAAICAREITTDKVAVFTESGLMARRLSSVRSGLQTFALTNSDDVRNQLALIWGVKPFCHNDKETTETMLDEGEKTLLDAAVVTRGETIVMMAGRLSGLGLSSSVIVWTIGEDTPRR
ncbi:MAG: Pyruvate kinase [uncultured Pyrinomonadaceae bacterium]|uniref:Pyruvate kinase n=1 Tax=uncultured Pyrinomonadaceae bacterium TaxID=2283094 RepID=A0A6J4PV71_9BACT|nr:MAG: Pyruvate kinase [uncultured Pyrinomonadaceae bacterium]